MERELREKRKTHSHTLTFPIPRKLLFQKDSESEDNSKSKDVMQETYKNQREYMKKLHTLSLGKY